MRTILNDEETELEITDEGFDSPLVWLKLTLSRTKGNGIATEIEIPLRELMGALMGFDAKRSRFNDEVESPL
jgi:hypothetical protein